MSIKLMNAAWESSTTSATDQLVLIALADQANDQGVCWPAVSQIAQRCKLSDRAIQQTLKRLSSDKHITIQPSKGRGNANTYLIHPHCASSVKGERHSPIAEKGEHGSPFISTSDQTEKVNLTTEKVNLTTEKVNMTAEKGEPRSPQSPIIVINHQQSGDDVAKTHGGSSEQLTTEPSNSDLFHLSPISVEKKEKGGRVPDLAWEALLDVCGIDAVSVTRSARSGLNAALAEIRGATPSGGAELGAEIRARAVVYREKMPEGTLLTAFALAKHWPSLMPPRVSVAAVVGPEVEPSWWREAFLAVYGRSPSEQTAWATLPDSVIADLRAWHSARSVSAASAA